MTPFNYSIALGHVHNEDRHLNEQLEVRYPEVQYGHVGYLLLHYFQFRCTNISGDYERLDMLL